MKENGGAFMFSDKNVNPGSMNLQSWLKKASKEERIEMARKIASTVEKSDDEMSYFDTANLEKMPKEERTWLAKKIASSVPPTRGYTGC